MLDGGRTVRSELELLLDVHNKPNAMCNNIKKQKKAEWLPVMRMISIIIWHSFEAIHRTMQGLNGNDKLFGDAVLLLSGGIRQTLSVIPCSTFADEINACLKQSFFYGDVQKQCD